MTMEEAESIWTLEDAEPRFSTLAEAARNGEPQRVVMDGGDAVVIVSATKFDLMSKRQKTLVEHLMDFPKLPEGMDDIFDDRDELWSMSRKPGD